MPENLPDIQRYLRFFLRRKRLFCLILFAVMGLSTIGSYFTPKEYEARTTILVQREQISNPLVGESRQATQKHQQVQSIYKLITTRSSLLGVIKRLQLHADQASDADLENLVEKLRRRLEVYAKKEEDLFQVVYRGDDPSATQDIANTVASLFIEDQRQLRWTQTSEAVKFIEDQLQMYKNKLVNSEKALKQFKEANLGQMPGAESSNLSRLEEAQKILAETELAWKEAVLKKRSLETQLAAEQPQIVAFTTHGTAETPQGRLQRLRAELATLLTNYSKKYPGVIRLKNEIEQTERQLAQAQTHPATRGSTTTSAVNPVYQKLRQDLRDIDIEIDSLKTRLRLYQERVDQYTAKAQNIPTRELDLTRLTRDYNVDESIYQMLLRRLEEARITRELDVNQKGDRYLIIDPAVLPIRPVKPDRIKIMVFSCLIGLMFGLGTVYFLEYTDTSLRDIHEVETFLALPVLGTIPSIITPQQQWRQRVLNLGFVAAVSLYTLLFVALLGFEVFKKQEPTLTVQDYLQHLSISARALLQK